MVALSAVMHGVLIAAVVFSTIRGSRAVPAPSTTYTVSLVDPAALGTNLPGGGGKLSEPGGSPKSVAPRPQPAAEVKPPPAVRKEEPKTPPPSPKEAKETVKLPDKEKPVEKPPVKPEPEKAKEIKPEPPPVVAKETKKPEPQQTQQKPEEKKTEPPKATVQEQSSEERDKQLLAAIDRIKAKVDKESPEPATGSGVGSTTSPSATNGPGAGIKGSGPATLGGAPGVGGGGIVRGLEYIMYTEQVKRRVKENWIVAERRDRLNAIVRFNVQPDGEISALEMLKSSGDSAFDQSVMRAVNKANPLPPPPEAYREEFVSQKVEVTFRSEEQTN
jgi:colicin import membrane protein